MSKRYRFIVLSLILITAALLIMMHNFPRIHHFGGIHLQLTDKEILQTATEILEEFGITSDDIYSSINIRGDQNFYTFLHREYGVRHGNELMRQGLPAAYYQVRWHDDPPSMFRILPMPEQEQPEHDPDEKELRILNNTRVNLDINGKVLFVRYPISESMSLPSLTVDEARETAFDFIDRHTPFSIEGATVESERSSELDARTDHRFTIIANDERIDEPATLNITVSGTLITSLVSSYDTPRYPELAQMEALVQAPIYIVTIISVLLAIVLGIKRIRSGEIGYRIGITFGVIAGIGFLLGMIFILGDEFVVILLLFFSVVALTVGAMTFIVWSVGETYGRETWRDHFRSLDLLSYGNLFHSAVSKSILGGIALGLLINAGHHLLILFASGSFDVWFALPQIFFNVYNAILPSVANYALVTYNTLAIVSIMLLFIPMLLLRRSHSVVLPLLTAGIIYGLANGIYIQPMPVGIIITAVVGVCFLFLFYRTDVLTLLFAFFTYYIADWGIIYLFTEHPELRQDGLLFIIPFIGLLVFSVGGLLSRDKEIDAESLEPHYVRFISERERLQREIEIAREVQMSFLPKMTPHVPDLDIAARCIPANEIGGDYYDFVQLHHNRTGILIGDVSGKGTKAAFYMTLAKGMMHTTINGKDSPAEVLTKVNEQFYRHTDRRAFISMVYGIFDTDKRMLTVSRAGHNPIIHFQKQQQKSAFIYPNGIALGLDKGEKFSFSIKDTTNRIEPGDIVVFYTDGITEAMNKNREEFGIKRLFETISDNQDNDARTLLENIFQKVNHYTKNATQNDDMTMIVVKMK